MFERVRQNKTESAAPRSAPGQPVISLALAGYRQSVAQFKEEADTNGGLPGQLKAGLESLSGLNLDDVRVHRESSGPAQMSAFAYTQGSDIYLGPGQDKYLPHEGWHAVQQKQGRVQPTRQLATGMGLNDQPELEHEADIMGQRAASLDVVQGAMEDETGLEEMADISVGMPEEMELEE
ncbi:hypothetical protein C4J81_11585 [Deltaproteobacteria bacterium Smac51]|nr:hypothetical protein C4J81_11585 [Deltaproteobacteria bacterium Smac51]